MADTVPEHYVTEFTSNWISRVQQSESRLGDFVTWEDFNGSRKRYDRIDQIAAQAIAARKAATRVTDASDDFRWCTAQAYDSTQTLDEFDDKQLGNLVLPTSDYIMQHAKEYHRTYDDMTWAAAIGNAISGDNGLATTALPAAQKLTTGGALTVEKLIEAGRVLDEADLDNNEGRVITWTAKMKAQLLRTAKATSSDYVGQIQSLVSGDIDHLVGFKFRQIQRLPVVSGTTKKMIGWQVGALKGIKGEKKSHLDIIPEFQHMLQVRSVWRGGLVRMHDELVVELHIDEEA